MFAQAIGCVADLDGARWLQTILQRQLRCNGVQPDEIERLGLAAPPKTAVSCAMRFFLPLADLVRVYLELRVWLGIGFVFTQGGECRPQRRLAPAEPAESTILLPSHSTA